jgi:hypothetical protein
MGGCVDTGVAFSISRAAKSDAELRIPSYEAQSTDRHRWLDSKSQPIRVCELTLDGSDDPAYEEHISPDMARPPWFLRPQLCATEQ